MFEENKILCDSSMTMTIELPLPEKNRRLVEFKKAHCAWFEKRFEESEIVCALPHFDEYHWKNIFNFSKEERLIERTFSNVCHQLGVFAIGKNVDCSSELIVHRESSFSTSDFLDDMPDDWDGEKVDRNFRAVQELLGHSIGARMAGAAGWMICNPRFLKERDELQVLCLALSDSERPDFPLQRSPRLSSQPFETQKPRQSNFLEFWKKFDSFCDYWRLTGMLTWDLPEPDGPNLTEIQLPNARQWEGGVISGVPWQFPLLSEDGCDIALRKQHSKQAAENGFDDQLSWKTYSTILKIDHWERVAKSRYSNTPKPKGFITKLHGVLESVLDINSERIRKLRKIRNQLLSGKRDSLKGCR